MKNVLLKGAIALTETVTEAGATEEQTQTAAQKINEFFTSDGMKATGYILLAVAVVAVAGYFLVKFLKSKKYIR